MTEKIAWCVGAAALALAAAAAETPYAPPPPYPGMEAWTFREELARPEPPPKFPVPRADGAFWVSNRISRCYFGPIKRPPLNHDELMDDVDYYPRPYLARLRREGVNGLWLTVEWRDLAETSFTRRDPNADRRLAKLRRTVDRCLEYGIKTWIFAIEPRACRPGDALLREHPDMFGCLSWNEQRVFCPFSEKTQRYVEESVRDIFTRVPRLGGLMMISHGERPTTCMSEVDAVTGKFKGKCPRCRGAQPWQMHEKIASAIMRGIRGAGSQAEYVSWFYQPYGHPERAPWVAETAAHLPPGVTLAYNFESGGVGDQLGRLRVGGDYWLSYAGPAEGFRRVAEAGRRAHAPIGAKIQVCNSHEVATVPYVPVPGLLYRKYRAMREMGVSTVLQCWYFGNYPGLMNEAAGLLSRADFTESEEEFLRRLAAPYWGPDALLLADIWRRYSDAYSEYPLSIDMQYYGPFHAGVAWPLLPDVWMLPLGRTWKPHDPPSGDAIGECLAGHTIEEAAILSARMANGMKIRDAQGRDVLDALAARWADDPARMRDLGVMRALACQFESGADIFAFYLARAKALYASRVRGDKARALAALRRMDAIVSNEERVTRLLLPLARADSRLGFHSEAEAHQYHPAKLAWRLGELKRAHARIAAISEAIARGDAYPLSAHERAMPSCTVGGDWVAASDALRFKVTAEENGDLTFAFMMRTPQSFHLATLDAAGVSRYRTLHVAADGTVTVPKPYNSGEPAHEIRRASKQDTAEGRLVTFTLAAEAWGGRDDRRPTWMNLYNGWNNIWPALPHPDRNDHRLDLSPLRANLLGRLVFPAER